MCNSHDLQSSKQDTDCHNSPARQRLHRRRPTRTRTITLAASTTTVAVLRDQRIVRDGGPTVCCGRSRHALLPVLIDARPAAPPVEVAAQLDSGEIHTVRRAGVLVVHQMAGVRHQCSLYGYWIARERPEGRFLRDNGAAAGERRAAPAELLLVPHARDDFVQVRRHSVGPDAERFECLGRPGECLRPVGCRRLGFDDEESDGCRVALTCWRIGFFVSKRGKKCASVRQDVPMRGSARRERRDVNFMAAMERGDS